MFNFILTMQKNVSTLKSAHIVDKPFKIDLNGTTQVLMFAVNL